MNPVDIKNKLASLEQQVRDLGYVRVRASLYINFLNEGMSVSVEYRAASDARAEDKFIHSSYEAGYDALFEKVETFIKSLPPIAEKRKQEFIAKLGSLLEMGREIGIEVDFINPLTDMMKKLSSNIITKVEDEVELPF